MLEIMFRAGSRSMSGGASNVGRKSFIIETADYIADTTRPEANFRVEVDHLLGHDEYLWRVMKTENNGPIIPTDHHAGENTLSLWFMSDAKELKIIISG
jgi:hypothetical protein